MGSGFTNDIMHAENVDFSGGFPPEAKVISDGQLLIGATASPNIRVNTLTPGPGVSITNGSGSITIGLSGGSTGIDSISMQTGTSPVLPDSNGLVTFNGSVVAAGTNPVRTNGTAATTMALQIQTSQAIAATDATKIGLCNFNSAQFSVDANGFVSTSGTGIPNTITGDSGGALSPTAGNWNILGGPGITTSGSGSTLTINSVVFTDQGSSTSVTSDSGSFATAAITLTLPAAPAQGDLVEFVCTTASALVVDAPSTHLIRIGNQVSSAGGTATSNAIGDSLKLRYRASTTTWHAISVIGTWTLA